MRHAKIWTILPAISPVLLFAVALGGAGCSSKRPAEEDEAKAIRAEVHTVALASPFSGTIVVKREQVEAAFLGRTTDRLTASGLRVVGPEVWDEIWRRYAGDVGGVYDVSTGKVDEAKYKAVEDATYRELAEVHAVDAILYLSVQPVDTRGVPGHPRVCGHAVVPYWPGGWFKWGNGASLVRTACLVGFLYDPSGKEYFGRQASIEGIETYDQQTRAVRPPDAIFKDPIILDRATEIVLQPLLAPAPPEGEAKPAAAGSADGASTKEKEGA